MIDALEVSIIQEKVSYVTAEMGTLFLGLLTAVAEIFLNENGTIPPYIGCLLSIAV